MPIRNTNSLLYVSADLQKSTNSFYSLSFLLFLEEKSRKTWVHLHFCLKWFLNHILILPLTMVCCAFAWCIWKIWRLGFKIGWLAIKHRVCTCSQHTIRILRNLYYANPYAFIEAAVFLTYQVASNPYVVMQVTSLWEFLVSCLPESLSYYLSFKPNPTSPSAGFLSATTDPSIYAKSSNSCPVDSAKKYSLLEETFLSTNPSSCQISSGLANHSFRALPSTEGRVQVTKGEVSEVVLLKNYYGHSYWAEVKSDRYFYYSKSTGLWKEFSITDADAFLLLK